MWIQHTFKLPAFPRGVHLVTGLIADEVPELKAIKIGIAHIFIHHTSASLTVNENADPTVRDDFERYLNHAVPEDTPYFVHTYEGSDDMPAHIKASLLGSAVTLPVADGTFKLGTWQGIYLCEHRNRGGRRTITVTVNGE